MSKKLIILLFLILIPSRSHAGDVSFAWDHSTSSNVVAYRMYIGTASRVYTFQKWTGHSTTLTVDRLPNGTWYFAVIAIDLNGNLSDFSNEVSTTVSGNAPPLPAIPAKVSRLRFGQVLNVSRETFNERIKVASEGKSPGGLESPSISGVVF